MNIFFLSTAVPIYSYQLANGLAEKDNVKIAFKESQGLQIIREFGKFSSRSKAKIVLVPHFSFPDPRGLIEGIRLFKKIREHKTTILHYEMGSLYLEFIIALMLVKLTNVPVITTVHDISPHSGEHVSKIRLFFYYLITKISDHAILHGESIASEAVSLGYDRRLVSIVPHGNYDIYHYADNAAPPEEPMQGYILLFGRMLRYKGLETLIKAAPIIAAQFPKAKIVLAGSGPELDRLLPEIKDNPIFEIHNRYIKSAEVKSIFTKAELVVLPYTDATQSGPLHLAYSFGKPVAASNVGAMPEALTDGVEGFLVEPGNPEALAEAIIKIIQNPDLAEKMGRAGRNKASKQLDWAGRIAELTRAAYWHVINNYKIQRSYKRPSFSSYMKKKLE